MPRPEYLNLRTNDDTGRHLATICTRLGLEPGARGSDAKAAKFAIRTVAVQMGGAEETDGQAADVAEVLDGLERALFHRNTDQDAVAGPTYWADELEATARQLREMGVRDGGDSTE